VGGGDGDGGVPAPLHVNPPARALVEERVVDVGAPDLDRGAGEWAAAAGGVQDGVLADAGVGGDVRGGLAGVPAG